MPRNGDEVRLRLQEAALELYLERGYDKTTTGDIAARAGVTERTFFRHFGDKREVFSRRGAATWTCLPARSRRRRTAPAAARPAGRVPPGRAADRAQPPVTERRMPVIVAHAGPEGTGAGQERGPGPPRSPAPCGPAASPSRSRALLPCWHWTPARSPSAAGGPIAPMTCTPTSTGLHRPAASPRTP